ncbi:MAG: pantoate--beta-alanine ligase [Candidatus Acidiferrales bacterium]
METIDTIARMKQVSREAAEKKGVVGLVPTMGALHEGHFSLVRAAQQQCSQIVVSIFVNPTQFGPSEDFQKYPRSLESDRSALEMLGVDYLFAPAPEEMYPAGFRTSIVVKELSDRLEGLSRAGHFRGVATVVAKLFEIVGPSFAYFGRKDAQQARIIRQMTRDLDIETQIVTCPIVRESDGLALSSRSLYLAGDDRRAATALYRSLESVERQVAAGESDVARLLAAARGVLSAEPRVKIDYAEIVDADTLEPVMSLRGSCLVLLAATVGSTRLIDNALVEQEGDSFRAIV